MAMSTDADVKVYEPTVTSYGIQEFSAEHAKTKADIERLLRIEWWPRVRSTRLNTHVSTATTLEMDATKLTESQFTRAAVFHALAYYILPKLSQFQTDADIFERKMGYYRDRFQEEFDLILKDGVEYDHSGDGTIQDSEKQTNHFNRLVR
jgi:hypothetical protein